jgi:hypothetical protein
VFIAVVLTAVFALSERASARPTPVVPSLEPAATAKLWQQLVERPRRPNASRQAACRPLRAIFYAQTDWLRLATRLAAQASPCAQYYISVPPLAAAKTTLRNGEAAKIRALGPNFHALAEINWVGWQTWVAQNSSTWFEAGVEARRRMAAAGYDVSKGDTWAVNEFPSSVRTGAGSDRQNARDLVRGLFNGDGGADTKGTVFIIGVGQSVLDTMLYQTNLQNWFGDSGFWADMTAYVADWSQEVYGDYRRVGVSGAPPQLRRDQLNDYLQHQIFLARAAPPAIEPGRTFIQTTSSPLANAAWSWASSYGYTAIPFDQMESFVSEQVYALRSFSAVSGQPQDHWGFAWAPRNPGLTNTDYVNQSRAILDRLGAAIRDSGQQTNPADPGIEACAGTCNAAVPGATFTQVWKSFRAWTQPVLTFTSAPQSLAAGAPSGPIALALLNATGAVQPAQAPITITLRSSSPRGQFSLAPTVLLPRHQSGELDDHRVRVRRNEWDPVGDDPPRCTGVAAGVDGRAHRRRRCLDSAVGDRHRPVRKRGSRHGVVDGCPGRARDDPTARRLDRELHGRPEGWGRDGDRDRRRLHRVRSAHGCAGRAPGRPHPLRDRCGQDAARHRLARRRPRPAGRQRLRVGARPPARLSVRHRPRHDAPDRPQDVPRPPQAGLLPDDHRARERQRLPLGRQDAGQSLLRVAPAPRAGTGFEPVPADRPPWLQSPLPRGCSRAAKGDGL